LNQQEAERAVIVNRLRAGIQMETSINIKENLTEVWGKEVWPPSSPDCNPFDYFVWGVSELSVIAEFRNKFKDLIQKMKELVGSLARDTLAKACRSFRSTIEAVFTANGSFIG
jgi:hypothetical protein